jgi:hypothetical protein
MRDTRGTMAQVARLFRKTEHPDPIKFILDFNMFLPSADNMDMDIYIFDGLRVGGLGGHSEGGRSGGTRRRARQKEKRLEREGGGGGPGGD